MTDKNRALQCRRLDVVQATYIDAVLALEHVLGRHQAPVLLLQQGVNPAVVMRIFDYVSLRRPLGGRKHNF